MRDKDLVRGLTIRTASQQAQRAGRAFGRFQRGWWAVLGWGLLAGCQIFTPAPTPNDNTANDNTAGLIDGNADVTAVSTNGRTRGEPDDTFGEALIAVPARPHVYALQGTIEALGDLDVFDLGPFAAGDRIVVDMTTPPGGEFDVSIALFDGEQKLFMDNDDRDAEPRLLDSYIDETVRHDSAHYYLAVGASAFAGSEAASMGSYQGAINVYVGGAIPPPLGQTLLLDFDGGTVPAQYVNVIGTDTVPAFNADHIAQAYAGQTDSIKSVIITTVRQNFEKFDVTVFTSDDPPPAAPYSTVLLGGYNPIAFGISTSVDHYNADHQDLSVIFTESFSPDVFSVPPTAEELGLAIGNVAAHEAGHILGLNHVNNPTDLMDAVSPADTFLQDQEFETSPLSEQILPLGYQDGLLLLAEILGLQ
jgi:hypothetical protein